MKKDVNENLTSDCSTNDWPTLSENLSEIAVDSSDIEYTNVRSNYMRVGSPKIILLAKTVSDVREAVLYAKTVRETSKTYVPFSIRSGGHGMTTDSVNDGGIILDVSQMNEIRMVDDKKGLVRVQAGAVWGDVSAFLSKYDRVISSGDFGDTGVGGLATAGGLGLLVRQNGLTIDHIKEATVVTADGRVHLANNQKNKELFWAIRGGISNVGIVTEFIFEAPKLLGENTETQQMPLPVYLQTVRYESNKLGEFVKNWGDWIRKLPNELTSIAIISKNYEKNDFYVDVMNLWAGDNEKKANPIFKNALNLATVIQSETNLLSYTSLIPTPHEKHQAQESKRPLNVLVDRPTETLGDAITKVFDDKKIVAVELRSLGGAVSTVPVMETSWSGRKKEAFVAAWFDTKNVQIAHKIFEPIRKLGTGAYGAYSFDTSQEFANLTWPEETGQALKKIKKKYDPTELFDQGLTII